jgi:hypothetical protein
MAVRDHFRSISRRPVSLRASVTTDSGAVGLPAIVMDLGLGGTCLQMARPLSEGQRLCIQLLAPNLWDPLLLDGRVAWQRPAAGGAMRVGVRFDHTSGATLMALVELIASHAYVTE